MFINTRVVVALMRLRGISLEAMGNLLHIPRCDLIDWLVHEKDDVVQFETQLEALKCLGINNDKPRDDVVHYWFIKEPLLGTAHDIYHDLTVITETFGFAEAVHITATYDPLLTTQAKTHFGLRFKNFYAMLEVTGHPLRTLRFDPDKLPGLEWVSGVQCVMLENNDYEKLEPGAMRVGGIRRHLSYNENKAAWDELQAKAAQRSLTPEAIATVVEVLNTLQLGNDSSPGKDALSALLAQRAGMADTTSATVAPPSPTVSSRRVQDESVEEVVVSVKHVPSQAEIDDVLFATPVGSSR